MMELLLGDALITLIWPRQHMRLWHDLVPLAIWRSGVRWFETHPTATRLVGLVQGGLMLRWAGRIYRKL
jgi:hypothetical protein